MNHLADIFIQESNRTVEEVLGSRKYDMNFREMMEVVGTKPFDLSSVCMHHENLIFLVILEYFNQSNMRNLTDFRDQRARDELVIDTHMLMKDINAQI